MTSRADREREFHDHAFQENVRGRVRKFYSITRSLSQFLRDHLKARIRHKKVLEYGCGVGSYTFFLAENGAEVTGIDISSTGIELAKQKAEASGLSIDFRVMNAEALEFEDATFDLVVGSGILHHLALDKAYPEIARVLRAGGEAVFAEALGHNPLINLYRRLTPNLRTPDEHPLLMSDLVSARAYFDRVDLRFYYLTTLLAIPFLRFPFFSALVNMLDAVDRALFRVLPFTRRYAWIAVLMLRRDS